MRPTLTELYIRAWPREFGETDTLFTNAQDKQKCAVVAEALLGGGAAVSVVVDIDN